MEDQFESVEDEAQVEAPQLEQKKPNSVLRFMVDVLETLVLATLLFIGINTLTARIRVDGFSMEPTMHNGEFVLVNRLAYKLGAPEFGDVIVFHFPGDPEQEYIKRVIGLPGDRIEINDKQVKINGHLLDEPYIAAPPIYVGNWVVPEDHLFVLGDNRNNSSDSHSWGPVPMENVVGRAVFVYWPISDWGVVEHINLMAAYP